MVKNKTIVITYNDPKNTFLGNKIKKYLEKESFEENITIVNSNIDTFEFYKNDKFVFRIYYAQNLIMKIFGFKKILINYIKNKLEKY